MTAVPTGGDRTAFAASGEPPLVIDLDGTLLRTDLLHESALSLVGNEPWLAGGCRSGSSKERHS